MSRIRCLATVLTLLVITLCVFVVGLIYSGEVFTVRRLGLGIKNKMEQKTPNITQYIAQKLSKISNPVQRHIEEAYFKSYMSTRNRFIQMLPRLTRQTPATNFHILIDKVQKEVGRRYDLIVLVSSYSMHWERRRNIRKYWGNATASLTKNWKLVFVTGGVSNAVAMKKLYDEAVLQRDIIVEDLPESWALNMGKKVMSALQWTHVNFDYRYILKTDDDVFVDIDGIMELLKSAKKHLVYIGNIMVGSEVLRSGRYGVSKTEYPALVYEPYCSGGGYVLSRMLIERMIPLFQWEHPLRIDDAYIGGRVIAAGGKAEHNDGFLMWNTACRYTKDLVVTHPADEYCMRKLHGLVTKKRGNKRP